MAPNEKQEELFKKSDNNEADENLVIVNELIQLRSIGDQRIIEIKDLSINIQSFDTNDPVAKAYAMVFLVVQGFATQSQVSKAFKCSDRTIRRYQRDYEKDGISGLARRKGPRRTSKKKRNRNSKILELVKENVSNREIGRRLGCCEATVRNVLNRIGIKRSQHQDKQTTLPLFDGTTLSPESSTEEELKILSKTAMSSAQEESSGCCQPTGSELHEKINNSSNSSAKKIEEEEKEAVSSNPTVTFDPDPTDRTQDRMLAAMGLLTDAAPVFANAKDIPNVGVLLAIPALVKNGVVEAAEEIYGCLGTAFYGLRTMVVLMVLMALLRIKRSEGLKEHFPEDLGRIIGLDRAPEVKTLRKKLLKFTEYGQAKEFGRALATRRAKLRGEALGFLYVDGHVRVYHGKKEIPKTHVTRLQRAKPATSDYWVNDAEGEPLFLVPTEANQHMVRALEEILEEVRPLIGERRTTVIFDRAGWSPKLFKRIINNGFDIMTYRKGKWRKIGKKRFSNQEAIINGKKVQFVLADTGASFIRNSLRLRQVTILNDDGSQCAIITSRRDLSAVEVAYRMTHRWTQENFFKYMKEEFALDALVDYLDEPADSERTVPNPQRRKLNAEIREKKKEFFHLKGDHGEEILNTKGEIRTIKGFRISSAATRKKIKDKMREIANLEKRRSKTPARIKIIDVIGKGADPRHTRNMLKS